MNLPVYLSYGLGVESTAILLRWIHEPECRDFPLSDLTVMTALMTDEYGDTKKNIQKHILPLLRQHRIRYVQVARVGSKQSDGIIVLEDSRSPRRLHINRVPFGLFDELASAGTVPNFAGAHRCSQKFKAWPLTAWMNEELQGQDCFHAFGYNKDETSRIDKSEKAFAQLNSHLPTPTHRLVLGYNKDEEKRIAEAKNYDTNGRIGIYPLLEWGWSREDCENYIEKTIGVRIGKSACLWCPFARTTEQAINRWIRHPRRTARGLLLERLSLSLNPKGTLFRDTTLHELLSIPEAISVWKHYNHLLNTLTWNLYRVRRIYTAKGKANRCAEILDSGSRQEMETALSNYSHLPIFTQHSITHYIKHAPIDTYPHIQELFTIAPALPTTKARHGIEWFNQRWDRFTGETQPNLFS